MMLSELNRDELARALRSDGIGIRTGPFNFRLSSNLPMIADGLHLLYAEYPLVDKSEFIDFNVKLGRSSVLRRWWRPQVRFTYDGQEPFEPLPVEHAFPLMEWAMNWCISTQAHHFLILHAAVIERNGCAVIMPAPPGSGKSTLCAGLIHRGWRLLSDELALISLTDGLISPLGRPVSLKNQSLEVIRKFAPEAVLNEVTHDTSKGSVSHMRVAAAHVRRLSERARPRWVVFPKYVPDTAADLSPRSKADSMLELGRNSFNYGVLGLTAFELLSDVITASDCYDFRYSQLEDAVQVFERLAMQEMA